jgi:hypothetical protein
VTRPTLEETIARLTGKQWDRVPEQYPVATAVYQVCPNCLIEVDVQYECADEVVNTTYHCPNHGAVTPKNSAVKNERPHASFVSTCRHCGKPGDQHFVGCTRPARRLPIQQVAA